MEEPKYMPSLESNTLENIDELVMFARERRGVIGLSFSLLLVKALAGVLAEQKRTYKNQEGANSDVAPYVRHKSRERLLYKELGIWCYLSYAQGASFPFLFQAELCLRRVCDIYGKDVETGKYLAFVLWSKWQIHKAQPRDMKRCFTLLFSCAQADALSISQLEVVWFRLGYLYQVGAGCTQDKIKALYCYQQARNLGLDC